MRASPVSIRICVPNWVVVRRSCQKKGGVQTDKGTLQLYIVEDDNVKDFFKKVKLAFIMA